MPVDIRSERAIERYADSVYRLALLREGYPAGAARATVAAFAHMDWSATELDERVEARLIAALPPQRRRLKDRLRRPRRPAVALPPAFWQLPPATRLALGMRLARGHNTQSIALALHEPLDTVQRLISDAIATLAGEDPETIEPACRRSRVLRLDESGAERLHLLSCDACRAAIPRWEEAERNLAASLGRSIGGLHLPREHVEAILLRLRATESTAGSSSNPLLLRIASVVLVVLVVLALLIMPRDREQSAAQPSTTARDIVEQAIASYGKPFGDGVVHQQLSFVLDEPRTTYEAEVWADPLQPARHRMQLKEGGRIQEWQSGDGMRAWRYFTRLNDRYCGPSGFSNTGGISRWSMPAEEQAALYAARWQTGPWALGKHLMEQALAAPSLRSLGATSEGETSILTLAAEGGPVGGTLLLRLDAATGSLREIRHVTTDNGQTRSQTRWRLLGEERIAASDALRAGVFSTYPAKQRPDETNRKGKLIDPACPMNGEENTVSVARVLGAGWPQVVGFPALPQGLDRAYLAGPPEQARGDGPITYDPESLALIYLGPGKRLVLRPRPTFAQVRSLNQHETTGETSGQWLLTLATQGAGGLAGTASPRQDETPASDLNLLWNFVAEGWTREELVTTLGSVRRLRLEDWLAQRTTFFDPEPLEPAVMQLVEPAARLLKPAEGRIHHVVVERELRQEPRVAALTDPYHALPGNGRMETWIEYGEDGSWDRYRSETWQSNGQPNGVVWGDSRHSQMYDARANVVRESPANWGTFPPPWVLEEAVRPVFRYRGFKVTARDATSATIAAIIPITETEYMWALQAQTESEGVWSGWPWLRDLAPETVTFRLGFDVPTGALRELVVTAPGPEGPVVLQRAAIPMLDVDADPPAAGWEFVPPAGTPQVQFDGASSNMRLRGPARMRVTRLDDALGGAPAPLWGWPEGHTLRFLNANVPVAPQASTLGYGSIDSAVEQGVAVELHYARAHGNGVALLEGPPDVVRALLQQTPPEWSSAEERTLPIAGQSRPAWIMSNERRHWAIFELDQTLVVLEYTGEQFEEVILPALADLEPL